MEGDFWRTVKEAREFFGQPIYAVIICIPTGKENPKYHSISAITPRDDLLATVKTFLREADVAAIFKGTSFIDIEISDSVPHRDEILAWLDANGARTLQ